MRQAPTIHGLTGAFVAMGRSALTLAEYLVVMVLSFAMATVLMELISG
jgi:hypothetical protein